MKNWVVIWLTVGILLLAAGKILRRKSGIAARLAAGTALIAPCAVCWLGMDFSPSFTMIFVTIGLCLVCLAEFAARLPWGGHPAFSMAVSFVFVLGYLWVFPAVCIYAAGDDLFNLCVPLAALIGLLMAIFQQRKDSRVPPLLAAWLCWSAVAFTALCGVNSVALLPCAAGLAALLIARRWQAADARRWGCCFAGATLVALFSALPGLL